MEKMPLIFLSGSPKPGATELGGKGKTRVSWWRKSWVISSTLVSACIIDDRGWPSEHQTDLKVESKDSSTICRLPHLDHNTLSLILFSVCLPPKPNCDILVVSEIWGSLFLDPRVIQWLFGWDSLHHSLLFYYGLCSIPKHSWIIVKHSSCAARVMFFRVTISLNI